MRMITDLTNGAHFHHAVLKAMKICYCIKSITASGGRDITVLLYKALIMTHFEFVVQV